MDTHDHCWNCISPSTCSSLTACPIVSCPDCSVTLHECNLQDHGIVCCERTVPCINVDYGCPDQVTKRLMGQHLAVCSMMTIQKISCDIITCEHCSMTMPSTDLNDHYLVCDYLPVPCSNASFGCRKVLKRNDINVHLSQCPASITQCFYMYSRTSDSGMLSITKDETSLLPDDKFFMRDQADLTEYPLSVLPLRTGLHLPSVSEDYLPMLRKGQRVSRSGEFVCGSFIRRDQFASHWLSHIELIDDLPLKIRRCPFIEYGCQHGTITTQPYPNESTFEYKDDFRSFVICPSVEVLPLVEEGSNGCYASQIAKKQELAMYGYANEDDGSLDVLGQLPIEVLLRILASLDSLSLWSLSQVNRYFRNVCEELLSTRGIVYILWEKDISLKSKLVHWKVNTKHWTFSKVFSSSHSWKSTDLFLSRHMESCEIYAALKQSGETSLNPVGFKDLFKES